MLDILPNFQLLVNIFSCNYLFSMLKFNQFIGREIVMKLKTFVRREEIIQYKEIINLINETVRSIRTQNVCLKRDLLDELLNKLGKIID